MLFSLFTRKRRREVVCGTFTTANDATPTAQTGDATAARQVTGVFTLDVGKSKTCEALFAQINGGTGDQIVGSKSYSSSTGLITITVIDISGAATADTNNCRVDWLAVFSDRVP